MPLSNIAMSRYPTPAPPRPTNQSCIHASHPAADVVPALIPTSAGPGQEPEITANDVGAGHRGTQGRVCPLREEIIRCPQSGTSLAEQVAGGSAVCSVGGTVAMTSPPEAMLDWAGGVQPRHPQKTSGTELGFSRWHTEGCRGLP
jgi:hypothetical protein